MDARETERYLNRLFKPGDQFEVLYTKPDGSVSRVTRTVGGGSGRPDFSTVLDEMHRAEEAGFNVYVSAMPLAMQAINRFDRIWVDQDDPTAPYPFSADPNWEGPQWPEPTTLVRTSSEAGGFRWQAIWLLDAPYETDKARSTMKRLARLSGADEAVHDARRVLRVPGLVNVKRGESARLISTKEGDVGLGAFGLPNETAVSRLLNADVNNPKHVLGEWLTGVKEGDRNRKAYVAARFLKGCGVGYMDAAAILKLGASRSEPVLDDRELEHAINSAFHRGS